VEAQLVAAADVAACRQWIARHSRSFHLSSLLLPRAARHDAWALYAFCRRADDAVDGPFLAPEGRGFPAGSDEPAAAGELLLARVASLGRRLDRVYGAASPSDAVPDAIDRAYAAVAARTRIPRALPEALLAGMEMDARATVYATWDELYRYCFRVASTVGLMMTRVMGLADERRAAEAHLRAADLGLAMQLTNIARDVGEDARRGRVYLPDELLAACGTDRAAVLGARAATGALREAVKRLLLRADDHYRAADRGIALLPRRCRPAIAASRAIYSAIGREVARAGYDSVSMRARTSLPRKLLLVARALPSLFAAPPPSSEGPADALLGALIRECGLDA
jgi:phytoene synthase